MIIKNVYPKQDENPKLLLAKNQIAILNPLGDVHFTPDETFPHERFKKHINWALERDMIFVGMGEYLDFTSFSQRKQLMPVRDNTRKMLDDLVRYHVEQLAEILLPTQGRWVGMLEGDHRWDFQDGTSADQLLCEYLNCDFLGTSALIRLKARIKGHPEADTILFVHHGIGTSRTAGGHLNRVEDLLKWIEADIYLMGHSHAKVAAPIDCQYISPDGVHYHRTKIIGRTGAWLRGYMSHEPLDLNESVFKSRGSYVEQKAYTPAALGALVIGIGHEKIRDSYYYRPALHVSL